MREEEKRKPTLECISFCIQHLFSSPSFTHSLPIRSLLPTSFSPQLRLLSLQVSHFSVFSQFLLIRRVITSLEFESTNFDEMQNKEERRGGRIAIDGNFILKVSLVHWLR